MRVNDLIPGRPSWSPEQLPDGFEDALARLRSRVLRRIGTDDALRDHCRSRALESALLLRLLERDDTSPASRDKLIAFLRVCRDSADPLDAVIAHVALHAAAVSPSQLVDDLVVQAPEFTSARKRVLMTAIFTVLGVQMPLPDFDGQAFSLTGLHCWANAQVTSVKVILAAAAGRLDLVTHDDRARLLATQRSPHVWEGNILIHLSVLHALSRLPDTEAVIADGIRKVLSHQREDGGMPFICDTDTWCSATGGVALLAAGAPRDDLHRLASHLVAQQRPDGGWAFTDSARQTDVDDISVVLQFLQTLDAHRYRGPIQRGIESLYAVRGTEGGFPTYVALAPSEACMTAAAIDALTPDWNAHRFAIVDGLRFLADQQLPDGSFQPDWSSSRLHTVFRVLLATRRNPHYQPLHVQRMVVRSMDLILQSQNDDGGWGQQNASPSDPISTAYAVIALCDLEDPAPVMRGLAYLMSHQRADGSIRSVSDSIGPRPFIFTVPALADIFSLLALGHVAHRTGLADSATLLETADAISER